MLFSCRRAIHFWGVFLLAVGSFAAQQAAATLEFYYDPLTGNVSFDTSNTRSGVTYSYGLNFASDASIEFRYENHIRLSNHPLFFSEPSMLADNFVTPPLEGLFTIGDVLPTGLTEPEWTNLFPGWRHFSRFPHLC